MQTSSWIRFVFHSAHNRSFLLQKTGPIPKASLSLSERAFNFYLFIYFDRQDSLPALFAQPSWIPSNLSSTPSFTHPNPAAAGHLGNAAACRMVQVTRSQEGESFKALDLLPPTQKCLCLCFFLFNHATLPFIQALLFSCQSLVQ